MFEVTIKIEIINKSKLILKKINLGRRGIADGNYDEQMVGLQKNYHNDLYIFCSYNKIRKVIQVCGWINKDEFFKKCSFFKKGEKRYRDDGSYFITKADLYEIKNSDLISLNNLDELKNVGKKN